MLKKIGYQTTNKRIILTEELQKYLREQYSYKSSTELSKKLNIPITTITGFWYREGLRGKPSRVYSYNENYFHVIDSSDKAYWLGFLAADGCVFSYDDNRQDSIILTLQENDVEILEKLKTSLNCNKPLYHYKRADNRRYARFDISSNIMSQDLSQYGIVPNKTYKYIFPDNIDTKYYRDFIRGFFDGDGCISKHFTQNTLYKVNITITGFFKNLQRIQEELKNNDIHSILSEDKRKSKPENKFGHIVFTNKIDKVKFLLYIYKDSHLYLERKYLLAQKFISLVSTGKKCWTVRK